MLYSLLVNKSSYYAAFNDGTMKRETTISKIRRKMNKTFIRFIFVGILNTIIGYSVIMVLFHLIGLTYGISYFLSYVIGVIISFFLNRQFVFSSKNHKLREFFRFMVAFFVSYSISYLFLYLFVEYKILHENIAFFAGMVVYSTLFYLLNKHITFKQQ